MTFYLWAGNQLLAEYAGTGVRETRYAYADGWNPEAIAVGASLGTEVQLIVQSDRLQAPRLTLTALGAPRWRGTYEVFGAAHLDPDPDGDLESMLLEVRLPGQRFDPESGLHYNRYRQHAPSVGSYLSADPIILNGANPYWYTGNPATFVDPLGLDRFVIMVGDPGLGSHNVGENFERAAETRADELRAEGHDVDVTDVSSVSEMNEAMNSGETIDGGLEYYGHGWDGRLYPGEESGPDTNLDSTNIDELNGKNLGEDARVRLNSCKAGAGGGKSIAQALADQLRRPVSGYESTTAFSGSPDGYAPSAPGSTPPSKGPLYVRPTNGSGSPTVYQPR